MTLARCLERAAYATVSAVLYEHNELARIFGSFPQHQARMHRDGSVALAESLENGFGIETWTVLLEALYRDVSLSGRSDIPDYVTAITNAFESKDHEVSQSALVPAI